MEHRSLIESAVLAVHRRNGGVATHLDFSLRLLDPSLHLDSMDLAEIVAELERRSGWSPMDNVARPVTWGDFAVSLESRGDTGKKAVR
jgi:hypothetical protein